MTFCCNLCYGKICPILAFPHLLLWFDFLVHMDAKVMVSEVLISLPLKKVMSPFEVHEVESHLSWLHFRC